MKHLLIGFFACLSISLGISSCKTDSKLQADYQSIKEEVFEDSTTTLDITDSADIFDAADYDPARDSVSDLLESLETVYEKDSAMAKKTGVKNTGVLHIDISKDSSMANKKDSFTTDIKKITKEELKALKYNLKQLHDKDSILASTRVKKSGRIDSRVWARISKKDQRLYLYIDGEIIDTFKVSTGSKGHETPTFDMQPNGPIFQKYTSKKYPGGNYNGLGNMPYVVFIKGGYALHGTTRGNIPKLGTKASHGCVRMHPDNAKIFNELVRKAGLENTWVTIEN